jgi:hypothetical protein
MASILLSELLRPKRKIFVSYHHGNDRAYYNEFARVFAHTYEAIQDNSVDRLIDSDDADYVIRKIREDYITGTSCTIVLCGSETPWRKFVDWEIKATLDKQHGLIGVNLPTNSLTPNRTYTVPDRLHDNIQIGYALWIQWSQLLAEADFLARQIEIANRQPTWLINNSRDLRRRNG